MPAPRNLTPDWRPPLATEQSSQQSGGYNFSEQWSDQAAQSLGQQASSSYIPEYSQTPILESIALQAQSMAPEVYGWGMQQWSQHKGDVDSMMRDALLYSSPERVASEMGQAQAGVMAGAEAGRQSAVRDLESFGIDPSSGRYAALDTANRVMAGAAAAGAGNQQRMATEAQGSAMRNQALSAGMQNTQLGYGAGESANQFLGTGMALKYSPLGQQSVGMSTSSSAGGSGGFSMGEQQASSQSQARREGGAHAEGGFIDDSESPTDGQRVDDVPANLTAGEFVIPKDIVEWKGQEFFYKLMAQARKMRATGGGQEQKSRYQGEAAPANEGATGYQQGGKVSRDDEIMPISSTAYGVDTYTGGYGGDQFYTGGYHPESSNPTYPMSGPPAGYGPTPRPAAGPTAPAAPQYTAPQNLTQLMSNLGWGQGGWQPAPPPAPPARPSPGAELNRQVATQGRFGSGWLFVEPSNQGVRTIGNFSPSGARPAMSASAPQ